MAGAQNLKVLLVDDEPMLCEIAKTFLEGLGEYEVRTCLTVNEALPLLQEHSFDAVVSDYQMPVKDGLGLLRWMRRSGSLVPFILFTGKGREEVAIIALNEGADFYLQKGGEPRAQFAELDNMIKTAVERRRSEEALRESERKYRLLAENVRDVIWKMDVATMRFLYISPSIEALRGLTAEEALAEDVRDSMDEESYTKVMGELQLLLASRGDDPLARKTHMATVRQRRKDGSWVTVEISATAIYDDEGRPVQILGVSRDVSDRIRVQQELGESNRRLETLMSNLPGMAYRCENDRQWTMHLVSEGCQALTGYPASALLHNKELSYADLILPEDEGIVWGGVQDGLRDGDAFHLEYRIRRADGKVRWVRELGRGVISPKGQVIALEGFIQDVTEVKEAIGELALANKKLNLLGSITRHDTYNMLTVIRGQAELGKMRASDKGTMDAFKTIDRMAANLQKAVDFTNLYQEIYSKEPAWQDLGQVIEAAIRDLPEGIKLSAANEVSGFEVCADLMLVKVLHNLLDNTWRHGVRATRAWFRCRESEGKLVLIYEDDGLGVPEGEKERIFERGVGRNFGYGLFLSKEILGMTDMTIREEGKPGKGARFVIDIPERRYRRPKPEPRQ